MRIDFCDEKLFLSECGIRSQILVPDVVHVALSTAIVRQVLFKCYWTMQPHSQKLEFDQTCLNILSFVHCRVFTLVLTNSWLETVVKLTFFSILNKYIPILWTASFYKVCVFSWYLFDHDTCRCQCRPSMVFVWIASQQRYQTSRILTFIIGQIILCL